MEFRNAKFIGIMSGADRWVDCEINHPDLGWIDTTISPDEDADFYADVASVASGYVPPPASELLAIERITMNPFRMAFRSALHKIDSPTPGVTLLQAVEAMVEGLRAADPLDNVVRWYDDVQQVVRLHPDIVTVQATVAAVPGGFSISDEMVDAICRVALAIDAMKPQAEIDTLVTTANGLWP
ncbi:hypothetical protein [uncultured Roseobacter sp.]|uniref:hypothetical protein n=1 Tax=uncultured Roseobacter sp. TaxID=114847 RepID=UPI002605E174|nr:hypothetical protein [uncultured Roseobacter sp.]